MQTQAGTDTAGAPRARGRKDASKQEKVIDLKIIKEKMPELCKLHNKAKDASTDFSDAIKAAAEKSGLLSSVVRRWVVAKTGANYDEKKNEAQQLAIIFEEVE